MNVFIAGLDKCATAETHGLSYNIYFSGCSIHCPGCHNKELWDIKSGKETNVDDLVADIKDYLELIDAVALLGGEPTDQMDGMVELLTKLQDLPIELWVYTGHYAGEVELDKFFKLCDYIKFGPYDPSFPRMGGELVTNNQIIVPGGRTRYAD